MTLKQLAQTPIDTEKHIADLKARLVHEGYGGGTPLVFRDEDRAHVKSAVYSLPLKGEFSMVVSRDYCVVGTRKAEDNSAILAKVASMRAPAPPSVRSA